MTKVCHMTSAHKSNDTRIFYKECVTLSDAGYDVFLVAQGISKEEKGVKIIGVGDFNGGRIKRMLKGTKIIYKNSLRLNADIYHFHDPELLFFGLMLKKKGKKVVFDVHENYEMMILEKKWIPNILKKIIQKIYNKIEKKLSNKFDAVIGVTPNMLKHLNKLNKKVYIITNYPVFKDNTVKNNKEISKEKCICFAGGISEQWCHDKIIMAIKNCENVRYKLIGEVEKKYMELLKTLPGYNYVDYKGKISYKEVEDELKKSDIGIAILQYSNNTFGKIGTMGNTKIFEEMAAGLPIICTDFDLWKKIIDKYQCGICVNPNNINEIKNAINYLVFHPEIAKRMGANGQMAIKKEYNWNLQGKKLLSLYQDLV